MQVSGASMDCSANQRHDSLSPIAEPRSWSLHPLSSPTCLKQDVEVTTPPKFKFIMAKVPKYDDKMMKSTHERKVSKPSQKQARTKSRDQARLPSLAATHPALYQTSAKDCIPKVVAIPPHNQHQVKPEPAYHPQTHPAGISSPHPPWATYVDPKRLLSQTPAFDDPKLRMLKMDVQADQACVISPVLMIGLPCGDMVEAAHVYYERSGQPRDAPSS